MGLDGKRNSVFDFNPYEVNMYFETRLLAVQKTQKSNPSKTYLPFQPANNIAKDYSFFLDATLITFG